MKTISLHSLKIYGIVLKHIYREKTCSLTALRFLSSQLQSGRHREANPGSGAGGRRSSLLSKRIHPPGRLPARCSLPAHHHLLLPEEQLGGPAAEGNTVIFRVTVADEDKGCIQTSTWLRESSIRAWVHYQMPVMFLHQTCVYYALQVYWKNHDIFPIDAPVLFHPKPLHESFYICWSKHIQFLEKILFNRGSCFSSGAMLWQHKYFSY